MHNLDRGRTSDLLLGEAASPFIEASVLLALTDLGKGDKDHTDDPISCPNLSQRVNPDK
jgi:hypothetical protein